MVVCNQHGTRFYTDPELEPMKAQGSSWIQAYKNGVGVGAIGKWDDESAAMRVMQDIIRAYKHGQQFYEIPFTVDGLLF